jgi:adenylate cyclase 2
MLINLSYQLNYKWALERSVSGERTAPNSVYLWFIVLQKLKMDDGTWSSSSSNAALKADQAGLRNRSPSKMTKYVECWGADKPFANITESTLAKNIGLTVSIFHPPC